MKTSLAVLAIASLIFAASARSQSKNSEGISKENNASHTQPSNNLDADQQKSSGSVPIKSVQPILPQDQRDAQYFDNSKHNPEKNGDSESRLVTVTFWLVIVGLVQAIILGAQAVLFFQQKKIMGQHKTSLEQLATAGRAWLLIKRTVTQDSIEDPYLPTPEQMMVEQRRPNSIFIIKNYGKTPARMIAWKYELQIGNSPTVIPDASIYEMKNLPVFTPDMIPQGTSVAQQADFRIAPATQDLTDVAKGLKFLWLCGTIRYEDTFGRGDESEHETVFCYMWEVRTSAPKAFWTVAGPAKYTKAT